jgi:hypothetical protein
MQKISGKLQKNCPAGQEIPLRPGNKPAFEAPAFISPGHKRLSHLRRSFYLPKAQKSDQSIALFDKI